MGEAIKLEVVIDENGFIREVTEKGEPLNYPKDDDRRIDDGGRLATENWCCWRKVGRFWRCGPC